MESPYNVSGFQSNNRKANWGHSSWKTRSLFWGIHHKIILCQKRHQSPHEKGQLSLQCHQWKKPLGVQGANLSLCTPLCVAGVFPDQLLSQQLSLWSNHIFPLLACKIQEKHTKHCDFFANKAVQHMLMWQCFHGTTHWFLFYSTINKGNFIIQESLPVTNN